MSVIDKALAAITPAPSAEKRAEATAAARDAAGSRRLAVYSPGSS
jgi:hypothetical protein